MKAAFCHEIVRSNEGAFQGRLLKPHVVRSVEEIFRLSQPAGLIKQFVERAASHFQTILEFSRDFPIKSDKLLNASLLSSAQRVELRFARAR